ncbi:MAG: choline kinase, partial [Deltaproteobacteria bacterium]|nr:choline kinase [Deltaproteobacteria bacterium]
GGGCGMKDVAYFLGSCLHEDECEQRETQLLGIYFDFLQQAVTALGPDVNFSALKNEWHELYHMAWVDFHRFIKGWTVENWHRDDYSERLKREVLLKLAQGTQ